MNQTQLNNQLLEASEKGDINMVKQLIREGADVNNANNYGYTPLMWANTRGHLEIVKYLMEQGANVNQADIDGWTPLIWASRNGHLEIVKYLVSQGADYSSIKNQPIFQEIIKSESNKLKTKLTERYGLVKNIPNINLPKDVMLKTIYEEPYQNYCVPYGEGLPPIQLIALANILNNIMPKKRGLIEEDGKYEPINLDISWKDLCKKVKQALYLLL